METPPREHPDERDREKPTIEVSRATHSRLEDLKPYDTMSFDELIQEMAGVYAEDTRRAP